MKITEDGYILTPEGYKARGFTFLGWRIWRWNYEKRSKRGCYISTTKYDLRLNNIKKCWAELKEEWKGIKDEDKRFLFILVMVCAILLVPLACGLYYIVRVAIDACTLLVQLSG